MIVMEAIPYAPAAASAGRETESALLVLVHPGSACGSTDFHHGPQMGDGLRLMLGECVRLWRGPMLIVDGELSDEIMEHAGLLAAIESGMAQNTALGHKVRRIVACDFTHEGSSTSWTDDVRAALLGFDVGRVVVTGAWYHPDDDAGCVNAVYDLVTEMGLPADIDDSAISIDLP